MKKPLILFFIVFAFGNIFSQEIQLDLIKIDESEFLLDGIVSDEAVSYTHLTLPTNREV